MPCLSRKKENDNSRSTLPSQTEKRLVSLFSIKNSSLRLLDIINPSGKRGVYNESEAPIDEALIFLTARLR
jgi:hypothetical protein